MDKYPNLTEKQIDWLKKQTRQLTGYAESIGVTKLTDNDFQWLTDTADAIINMVVEKSTNMAQKAQARMFVLNTLARIETEWRNS